jgi:hypothetical protein
MLPGGTAALNPADALSSRRGNRVTQEGVRARTGVSLDRYQLSYPNW